MWELYSKEILTQNVINAEELDIWKKRVNFKKQKIKRRKRIILLSSYFGFQNPCTTDHHCYLLQCFEFKFKEAISANKVETLEAWHQRIGHQNVTQVKSNLKKYYIPYQGEDTFFQPCMKQNNIDFHISGIHNFQYWYIY